jgi:hypothetical protein
MRKLERAQSLIEVALFFPILMILLSGLIEFGFLFNENLAVLDAVRNAARFSSDKDYKSRDLPTEIYNCYAKLGKTTEDFYRQTSCVVLLELLAEKPSVSIDPSRGDDIIISVFSITQSAGVVARYPNQHGWSYAQDLPSHNHREQISRYSEANVNAELIGNAPSSGLLLVEIFYNYEQKLNLPWLAPFLPNPVLLHIFAFMPLSSAEPH